MNSDELVVSKHIQKQKREMLEPLRPVFLFLFCLFIIILKLYFIILPEIGHKILMNDDYYGLARSEIFMYENIDCSERKTDRVSGISMGLYSYEAIISSGCYSKPNKKIRAEGYVRISVRRPHTFLTPALEISGSKKFTTEYYKAYDVLNKFEKN